MNNTLSDYDLLKMRCDERQAIIAAKDAEIERLKNALNKIYRLYVEEEFSITALKMAEIAALTLQDEELK